MKPIDNLKIYSVRGKSVVLDSDLSRVYGVETCVFNQAFRRNQRRFPKDFAFQLTDEEWRALRSQFVTLNPVGRGQRRKYLPWMFTEHGALMAVTILNSSRAVAMECVRYPFDECSMGIPFLLWYQSRSIH